jgi:hypothetical protein
MYLRFGIRLIVEIFCNDALVRVCIPLQEKISEYIDAIGSCHPLLADCWRTMDVLKLYLQQTGNTVIKECFYNGWTHDHYVTSVFSFCPDRAILIAFLNVPGSIYCSQVAEFGNIYGKLETSGDHWKARNNLFPATVTDGHRCAGVQ